MADRGRIESRGPPPGDYWRQDWARAGGHRGGGEEGANLLVERLYTRSGLPPSDVAVQVLRRVPDVIAVPSAGVATAFRMETPSIPIVAIAAGELVGVGLAESLARAGGNVTGTQIVQLDLMGKRLQLLKQALPRSTRVAALQEATTVPTLARADARQAFEAPARERGLESLSYEVGSADDFDESFRMMDAQQVQAVIVRAVHSCCSTRSFLRNSVPSIRSREDRRHEGHPKLVAPPPLPPQLPRP